MGDQVGQSVRGKLVYIPREEFQRLLHSNQSPTTVSATYGMFCRINALYMIARAGSGHIGSTFSSLDIMSWLQLNRIYNVFDQESGGARNIFFSSKGHDAPALYSTLIGLGLLEFDLIHRLRKFGGLPGHPDVATPHIVTNTGSLGMGVSKAKGMVLANRLNGKRVQVFVLTGDGELQEGQVWESLMSAANDKMEEMIVIVDHNKLQSDTLVEKVCDLGDLNAKFASFGWHVQRCDGHDLQAFERCIEKCESTYGKPHVIIADTIKGKGVSFMEHTSIDSDVELYKFHSGAPTESMYVEAVEELIGRTNGLLHSMGLQEVKLLEVESPEKNQEAPKTERLIPAYSSALLEVAATNKKIVALDADLILDTGLIPFKQSFPERFIECGIAEQDMVSQAGGLALSGFLPVVHSFSCFLSARANEHIYNNSTEKKKIVYVGSLAGVLPGGPGHSHQAVRDIASLGGIPGLMLFEPCNEAETRQGTHYCLSQVESSCYIRLSSIPYSVPFSLPDEYSVELGKGVALTKGEDAVLFGYGSIMLSEAYVASKLLLSKGISVRVINMPWLNTVDMEWLRQTVEQYNIIFTLDNHYIHGGQGDFLLSKIGNLKLGKPLYVEQFGLDGLPACGTNAEVLQYHGLDARSMSGKIETFISAIR